MSIRKRPWVTKSGQQRFAWLVDYKDQAGKRRTKQFARKKDAEAWVVTAAAEIQKGVHTPDSISITVTQAAELYLESVRANDREPTTIAAYDQQIRLHIIPECGGVKLSQLTAPIVKTYLTNWQKKLSQSMSSRVLRTFKAIITEAQSSGFVAQNVALPIRPKKTKRTTGKVVPPTKSEIRSLLQSAQISDDLLGRAILELVVFTGLRASEIRGLNWGSVDLKKQRITVNQRAEAHGLIGLPKSDKGHRTIPLPPRLVALLTEWKVACPPHKLDLVFPSHKGKVLSYDVMTKNHMAPLQLSAGLSAESDESKPRYSMHPFRHAAASLWIEQGLNPKRIQYLMGHSSIQVTFDTYGHLFDQAEKDDEDALAIERALFPDATL